MDEPQTPDLLTWEACRVLGSLLEKELTVPATYPMTLNALVTACNQASGRNPVTTLGDQEVMAALDELRGRGLTRVVHASHGARTTKYRQVADEVLGLEPAGRAALTLLLLRGAQTPGELRTRSDRLHRFGSVEEVSAALAVLAAREPSLVEELPRSPGQKEARWRHLLAATDGGAAAGSPVAGSPVAGSPSRGDEASAPAAGGVVDLDPALEPLRAFIGRWEGAGAGEYPTIEGFSYTQIIELLPVAGKPFLSYRSTTRRPDSGLPMHAEVGWLRLTAANGVELVIAQGSGLVEVAEGVVETVGDDGEVLLESTSMAGTATAKDVSATERRYRVSADRLECELAMAAVGEPLTHHLRARLHRT